MRVFTFILFALFCTTLKAEVEGLEVGKIYRLNKTLRDVASASTPTENDYVAAKDSKFKVVYISDDSYVVRFVTIYEDGGEEEGKDKKSVEYDEEYLVKKSMHAAKVPLDRSVTLSKGGPVSGPLIVPFKYRLDDDSLTGEATIGYYAGYNMEPRIWFTDWRVPVSPFIAAGLSQVSVSNNGDETNQTGVTLAVGILVQDWAGVNIGLVYGQDRIGDKSWEHEGEDWVSFMVGWQL